MKSDMNLPGGTQIREEDWCFDSFSIFKELASFHGLQNKENNEDRHEGDAPKIPFKGRPTFLEITKDIALLSDYEQEEEKNVPLVKELSKRTGAQITLYGFVQEETQKEILLSKMEHFTEKYALGPVHMEVIVSSTKEKSARALLSDKSIQLMVITDINRKGLKSLVKGNLEMDILNHTAIPILAI